MADFLPKSEGDLIAWTINFSARIVADPAAWGVPQVSADTLALRQQAWVDAFRRANLTETRGPCSTAMKDEAKRDVITEIRRCAWYVRAKPGMTNAALIEAGLRPRVERHTPVGTPAEPPLVKLVATGSHTVAVTLIDKPSGVVRRPVDAAIAEVYLHLGDEPPAEANAWQLHSLQSRPRFDLNLDGHLPYGQQVWVCVRWSNPRGRPGPMSRLTSVRVLGGPSLRLAQRLLDAA